MRSRSKTRKAAIGETIGGGGSDPNFNEVSEFTEGRWLKVGGRVEVSSELASVGISVGCGYGLAVAIICRSLDGARNDGSEIGRLGSYP